MVAVYSTHSFTVKEGAAMQPFDTLGPTARRRIGEKLDVVAGLLAG